MNEGILQAGSADVVELGACPLLYLLYPVIPCYIGLVLQATDRPGRRGEILETIAETHADKGLEKEMEKFAIQTVQFKYSPDN